MNKINKWKLLNAEQVRLKQTAFNQRKLYTMYREIYLDTKKKIKQYGGKDINKANLILLERNIKTRMKQLNIDIQEQITNSMYTTANAVVEDTRDFMGRIGFKPEQYAEAFLYVPEDVVASISMGTLYQEGWSLSNAIWGHTERFNEKLSRIVASGTAQSKSAYDIALDLEQYVNPEAKKVSKRIVSWVIDEETGQRKQEIFYFGNVDYNAQRLARTMVSHAYQQSFMRVNEKDPFVHGYKWETSNFHGRICSWCKHNAEQNDYGLGVGVFPKDELPLDHPNGMCTFTAVTDDLMDISTKLAKWYKSPLGTYPDIDDFAKQF